MKKNEEKILKWRLSEKPTALTLQELVKSEIITKDEARQILLDETEYNSKDFDDVLDEIKLLRSLVLELASRDPQKIIQYIQTFPRQPWSYPYTVWCSTTASSSSTGQLTGGNFATSGVTSGTNSITL